MAGRPVIHKLASVTRRMARFTGDRTRMPGPLSPQYRAWYRRARYVFPPHFPELSVGLWSILKYCDRAGLKGDVVECGVGRGRSFALLGWTLWALGSDRRLIGFDSFLGFPEPTAHDASSRRPAAGEWSDTSEAHIRQHFSDLGLADFYESRCRLVPGFFSNSLPAFRGGPICFLNLDVDLYESYRTCLGQLAEAVSRGGLILLDEYGEPKWPGATLAVDAFMAGDPGWRLYRSLVIGKHFLRQPAPDTADPEHWNEIARDLKFTPVNG